MSYKDKLSDDNVRENKNSINDYILIENSYSKFDNDQLDEAYKQLVNDADHIEHEKITKLRRYLRDDKH